MSNKIVISKEKLTNINNTIRKYSLTTESMNFDEAKNNLSKIEKINLNINGEEITFKNNLNNIERGDVVVMNEQIIKVPLNSVYSYSETPFLINLDNYLIRIYDNINYENYRIQVFKKQSENELIYLSDYILSNTFYVAPNKYIIVNQNKIILFFRSGFIIVDINNDNFTVSNYFYYNDSHESFEIEGSITVSDNKFLLIGKGSEKIHSILLNIADLDNISCIITQLNNYEYATSKNVSFLKLTNNTFVMLHNIDGYTTLSFLELDDEDNVTITSHQISSEAISYQNYLHLSLLDNNRVVAIYPSKNNSIVSLIQTIIKIDDKDTVEIVETRNLLDMHISTSSSDHINNFEILFKENFAYFIIKSSLSNSAYFVCFKHDNFVLTDYVYIDEVTSTISSGINKYSNFNNDILYFVKNHSSENMVFVKMSPYEIVKRSDKTPRSTIVGIAQQIQNDTIKVKII